MVLSEGFVDENIGLAYYTDHQIFNRYFKFKSPLFSGVKRRKIKHLTNHRKLNVGDYLVHIDYGVGRFLGVVCDDDGNDRSVSLEYLDGLVSVDVNHLSVLGYYEGASLNVSINSISKKVIICWTNNIQAQNKKKPKERLFFAHPTKQPKEKPMKSSPALAR